MTAWTGRILNDRFEVGEPLGQGGMAAVYLASDLRLGRRTVVVKHPLREQDRLGGGLSDDDLRQRFAKEVERLTHLDDIPGVVPILDQGVHEGTPFYVMRHMAGGSLFDLLRQGPQAPAEALGWLRSVAEALDRLHERGVLHRDVKPENLLFDHSPTGPRGAHARAHLADFGIVKELQQAWATTGRNTGIGTPGYMAPEQLLEDAEPDGRADQFALAATLYHALTGSRPQYATTAGRAGGAPAAGRKRLRPVSELAAHVPPAASAVVERALAREPEERFPTCAAFAQAFAAALEAPTTSAGAATSSATRQTPRAPQAPQAATGPALEPARTDPAPPPAGGGRRGRRALLLVVLLGLLAGGAYLGRGLLDRAEPGPQTPPSAAPAPDPAPAPAPAPAPTPPPDTEAPVVEVTEPSGAEVVTTVARVTVKGVVRDGPAAPAAGPVDAAGSAEAGLVLRDGEAVVVLTAGGAFAHEVALEVDESRTVRLVATDRAGNVSAPVLRTLKREAAWAAALREAEAARGTEDGEAVRAALARAVTSGVPHARVKALTAWLAVWDQAPEVTLRTQEPQGEAVAGGAPRPMRVRGTWTTGRRGDRLLVDGREVSAAPGPFEATLSRGAAGRVEVPWVVRAADGTQRRTGTLGVTFETPPPAAPREEPVPSWAKVSPEQVAEAARLKVPVAYEEPTTGIRFVLIPGGTLLMGSPEGEEGRDPDEGPQHRVTLGAFYLSVHEVTNGQYRRKESGHRSTKEDGHTHPVTDVDWDQATAYAAWLDGRGTPKGYALPTEAQWEHACRAGTTTRWSSGDNESQLVEHAWFDVNSDGTTHPVGGKAPNRWGLFDMHGNVREWCADDYHSTYAGAPTDGRAWVDSPRAARRVYRGGSWFSTAQGVRSAFRSRSEPSLRNVILGFRLARAVTAR